MEKRRKRNRTVEQSSMSLSIEETISELGEAEAASHIIELVNDPDTAVQLAAIQTLGKIGSTETKECLEHCLNNPSDAIRQAAEQALHELEVTEDPFSFRVS